MPQPVGIPPYKKISARFTTPLGRKRTPLCLEKQALPTITRRTLTIYGFIISYDKFIVKPSRENSSRRDAEAQRGRGGTRDWGTGTRGRETMEKVWLFSDLLY
jgi:hypothetical protein